MSKIRLLLVSFVAVLGMAFAATTASAVTVANPGLYTIGFPAGGLTFNFAGSTAFCSASAHVSVASTGAGLLLDMDPYPCFGITGTGLSRMTHQISAGGATGFIDTIAFTFGYSTAGGLINCLYAGNLVLPLTSRSTLVGGPSGTFTSACPAPLNTMIIGGTGGTLSTALTILP